MMIVIKIGLLCRPLNHKSSRSAVALVVAVVVAAAVSEQ